MYRAAGRKSETRLSRIERNPNDEIRNACIPEGCSRTAGPVDSSLGFRASFVIYHSLFVILLLAFALSGWTFDSNAAAPIAPPEKLLPDDTLVLVTAPDFAKLRQIFKASAQSQLWNDPAMRPFKDKFVSKWNDDLVKPLERELNMHLDDYTSLLQGQLTLALTQNGALTTVDQPPGFLLLLDSRDRSNQLKTNLANIRKQWTDSGKTVRTEKIRGVDFSVLSVSSNDVPQTLRKLFPSQPPAQTVASESEPKKESSKNEIYIGQVDSLLVLGNVSKVVERVVSRLTGGSSPVLADLAAYDANHQALFRDAPFYAWINIKAFIDMLSRKSAEPKDPDAPDPSGGLNFEKIAGATGLSGLKTVGLKLQVSSEGSLFQVFLGVPETARQGLFKILAGEAKDSNPPQFVPADAIKFQRWRIDGQKTWATLEKMLSDISPQAIGTINFLLDSANAAAREKDPAFDIKKNLIGNLGDDMVSYQKAPRGSSGSNAKTGASIFLLASPHPQELAAALKTIMGALNPQGGPPTEREFLGRKIFTVTPPSLPLPIPTASAASAPRPLNVAASGSYVAFSSDASILEEYLRSSESQAKSLRETAGLNEAEQRVVGPGTGMFGYENQSETMRTLFDTLKNAPGGGTNALASPLAGAMGMTGPQAVFNGWMDFSLLPPFDKVAKYFYFTVYGGTATADGITFKVFAPTAPALRETKSSAPAK